MAHLGNVQQVNLQEEGGGAGGNLFGDAADGETQLVAHR